MTSFDSNISSYKTISILGHCFNDNAVVHLAKHKPSGTMVAIKKFDMDKIKEGAHLVQVKYLNKCFIDLLNFYFHLTEFSFRVKLF